jgi:aryl-alcohol dehydrogenase-like predicted oxidoreductase
VTRLALGTVQFGLRYGVANESGQIASAAIAAILQLAATAGLDTLDTGISYGESEANLGSVGVNGWRVITKLPSLHCDTADVDEWVETQIRGSLLRLRVEQLEAVLVHRAEDLLTERGAEYLRSLQRIKRDGLTRAVGVSVYSPNELERLCTRWCPDLVQAPYNVLDRRLLSSGWLERLRRHGVRVHVRSAFMQGLLLMSDRHRPKWFTPWNPLLNRWLAWCREHEMQPLRAALGFALAQDGIERVVVGVDSVQQLDEILRNASTAAPVLPDDLCSQDLELIEPRRWKLA